MCKNSDVKIVISVLGKQAINYVDMRSSGGLNDNNRME